MSTATRKAAKSAASPSLPPKANALHAAVATLVAVPAPAGIHPVAPESAPFTLDEKTRALLRADGGAAYEGEQALKVFAEIFQPFMVTATQSGDFVGYTEAARQWRIGYEQTRRNTPKDDGVVLSERSQDAFERRRATAASEAQMGEDCLLGDKPKSVSADAQRKAQAREAMQAAIAKAIEGKTLVQLNTDAGRAEREAKAKLAVVEKAREAAAKANKAADPLMSAKAQQALEAARLAAADANRAAQTAALHAETMRAKVLKDEAVASAEKVKGFREQARALIAEANEVQLLQVIKLLEKAGVKTAAEKKAAAAAAAAVTIGIAPV